MPTTQQLLQQAIERLRASGSESPRLDAELLLGKAIGVDRTALIAHPAAPVGADAAATFNADLARRERGEPIAYIRGFKEFFGIAMASDPRALIPRPETERLVDLATREIVTRLTERPRSTAAPPLRVLDVGVGAGTISIALAVTLRRRGMQSAIDILGTDLSADALALARENAVGHGVADVLRFAEADLVARAESPFDVVLANLPYVPSGEVGRLPVAASFEPQLALDGGPDGLDVVRRLLARLPGLLTPDGVALLEIGSDQVEALRTAVDAQPVAWTLSIVDDLGGRPRVARLVLARSRREPSRESSGYA
jgi:release factor glutamine methyltransferase